MEGDDVEEEDGDYDDDDDDDERNTKHEDYNNIHWGVLTVNNQSMSN